MKSLWKLLPVMVAMAGPCVAGEERLIPMDQFFISVETNDWLKRPENRDGLSVSVSMARAAGEKAGTVKVEVDCYKFESAERGLSEEDRQMFLKAAEAATRKEAFSRQILSPTLFAKKETLFETKEMGGEWVVAMTRGENTGIFVADEGERLAKALVQARAGEKWFKELLYARKRPEPTAVAYPPRSHFFMLSSTVGKVGGRGIDYEVTVSSFPTGEDPYHVEHWLRFGQGKDGTGSSSGEWVEVVLRRVADALVAVGRGAKYSFDSPAKEEDGFSVVANLETREAEVTIVPGSFFPDRAKKTGHFGEAQLAGIRKLLEEAQPRMQWFKDNEGLFFDGPDF